MTRRFETKSSTSINSQTTSFCIFSTRYSSQIWLISDLLFEFDLSDHLRAYNFIFIIPFFVCLINDFFGLYVSGYDLFEPFFLSSEQFISVSVEVFKDRKVRASHDSHNEA